MSHLIGRRGYKSESYPVPVFSTTSPSGGSAMPGIYVDGATTNPTGNQTGKNSAPFKTIQQALDAAGLLTDLSVVIYVAGTSQYAESLVLPIGKILRIEGVGGVATNVGDLSYTETGSDGYAISFFNFSQQGSVPVFTSATASLLLLTIGFSERTDAFSQWVGLNANAWESDLQLVFTNALTVSFTAPTAIVSGSNSYFGGDFLFATLGILQSCQLTGNFTVENASDPTSVPTGMLACTWFGIGGPYVWDGPAGSFVGDQASIQSFVGAGNTLTDSSAFLFLEPYAPPSHELWVDGASLLPLVPDVMRNGSPSAPFETIGAAVAAIIAFGFGSTVIHIAPKQSYGEDLVIPPGVNIILASYGATAPGGIPIINRITLQTSVTGTSCFSMINVRASEVAVTGNPGDQRLDVLVRYDSPLAIGSTFNDSALDASVPWTLTCDTGNYSGANLICDKATVRLRDINGSGSIQAATLSSARNCSGLGSITVTAAPLIANRDYGFFGCTFASAPAPVFTGPVGSFMTDNYSKSTFVAAGGSLAGGATYDVLG